MQIDAPNRDFPRRCEKQGGMAQSVGHLGRNFKPTRGGMAQSVGHFVKISILSDVDVNEAPANYPA